MRAIACALMASFALLSLDPERAAAITAGTAFTYQGRLTNSGNLLSNTADFQFTLWDALAAGVQIGPLVPVNNVTVTNGLFTVAIDFGTGIFTGDARWLEINVRSPAGGGSFTLLTPRQPLTPAPYAMSLSVPATMSGNQLAHILKCSNASTIGGSAALVAQSTATTGVNWALLAQTASSGGTGALGWASNTAGTTYGVFGQSDSTAGRGVYGIATSASGTNYGVHGKTNSTSGYAGYFEGQGYFSGNLGIGVATPSTKLQVNDDLYVDSVSSFVGVNRSSRVNVSEFFGIQAPVSNGYGGMYIRTDGTNALPFYGYTTGTQTAWTYLDGASGAWRVNVSGDRMTVTDVGDVGIGTTTPGAKLHVNGTLRLASGSAAAPAVNFGDADTGVYGGAAGEVHIATNGTNVIDVTNAVEVNSFLRATAISGTAGAFHRRTTDGVVVEIQQDFVAQGSISVSGTTVSYNAFTGSHLAWTDKPIETGTLVTLTGSNRRYHDDPRSEIVYGIAPSCVANDPRCLGAYLSLQEPSKPAGLDNPHLVMAVGNGDMWVTDTGSRIQPGDYLIASNVRGCAMRDDPARYPIGYIIARAAEPLDFSKLPPARQHLKQAKISVLFESFVRNSEAARLAEIVESQQREIQTLKAQTEQAQAQLKELLGEVRQFKARIETDYDKAQAAGQGHESPGS